MTCKDSLLQGIYKMGLPPILTALTGVEECSSQGDEASSACGGRVALRAQKRPLNWRPATSAAPHALDPGSPRSQGSFNIFNLSPQDFSLSPLHRGHNDSQQVSQMRGCHDASWATIPQCQRHSHNYCLSASLSLHRSHKLPATARWNESQSTCSRLNAVSVQNLPQQDLSVPSMFRDDNTGQRID